MKCPTCERDGIRSIVHVGGTTSTLMTIQEFYDEEGRHHRHDYNNRTTSYRCSNGHEWTESIRPKCWCEGENV